MMERIGKKIDDEARFQWEGNRAGLLLTALFIIACVIASVW